MYKNKITKAVLFGTGLILSATSMVSYAANVPPGTKLAKVQDLVRYNDGQPASIDPQKVQGVPGQFIINDLFEGLVTQNADGDIIPGIATSWDTKDNKTYIFHLRDAKWSNGKPVTAGDFVYAFRRAVNPATASPYAWYVQMTTMKNAGAIIDGKKKPDTLGVKALNPHTLEVQLNEAIPYFLKMLASATMMPVYPPAIEKWGDKWTQPAHLVSDGAYTLDKRVPNGRIVLKRNPDYWNNNKTVINQVTYLATTDPVAAMNRFLAGEVQMTYETPADQYKRLKKEYPQDLKTTGSLCTYFYDFNTQKKPFNDVRVRKALSYSINRDIIANAILGQGQKPAYNLTPDIIAGFKPITPAWEKMTQAQRVAKAKELLKEAGYSKSHPLSFTLIYNTDQRHKKIATALQAMWKQELGVNVTLENQEWKTFLNTRQLGNFQMARDGWCGDYNEASTFLNTMMSTNVQNNAHFKNKKYDSLIKEAMKATSTKQRNDLYHQAEQILAKYMPIAPIYQYVNTRLVSPTIGGYPMHNAQDNIYTRELYIKAK
ncbi:ABC transporter substrate-binding protein [Vibrio sp. S4M6]|uniref:ABC transporter substrate-binding protein n=1 Tax=Vibrio sinus TaxID=2946865 RepID=UPI00202A52DD|nr:ABC transporter substrate-binding protein [Vibrio sinus]MCL9782271.1 ABC transporter substrate-binding protein [Vibrio sinus]